MMIWCGSFETQSISIKKQVLDPDNFICPDRRKSEFFLGLH